MHKNKIRTIPQSITDLLAKSPKVIEYMETLKFSHNRLREVPDCFFLLGTFPPPSPSPSHSHSPPPPSPSPVNLKSLDISHNELEVLSPKIVDFYRLGTIHRLISPRISSSLILPSEQLYVDHNELTLLPYQMNKMRCLRTLTINNNKLEWLPNSLAEFASLLSSSPSSTLPFSPSPEPLPRAPLLENIEILPNPLDESYKGLETASELMDQAKHQRIPKRTRYPLLTLLLTFSFRVFTVTATQRTGCSPRRW